MIWGLGDRNLDGPPADTRGGVYVVTGRVSNDKCWRIEKSAPFSHWADKLNNSEHYKKVSKFGEFLARKHRETRRRYAEYITDDGLRALLIKFDTYCSGGLSDAGPEFGTHFKAGDAREHMAYAAWCAAA